MRISLGIFSLFAGALLAVSNVEAGDHLAVNQWVRLNDAGSISGRLVVATADGDSSAVVGADVVLINDDGDALRTQTNEAGKFKIAGASPGVYAFAARGGEAYVCCAMHVLAHDSVSNSFPSDVEICAARIDYATIKAAVVRYLPPAVDRIGVTIAGADLETLSDRVGGGDLYQLAQSGDGMVGRLHLAGASGGELVGAELMNVFIIRDGVEVARTVTDNAGAFEIESVDPGYYSLLSIGPGGVGLVGFELVADPSRKQSAQVSTTEKQWVSLQGASVLTQFEMQVAPPQIIEDVVISEQVVEEEEGVNIPFPGDAVAYVDGVGTPLSGGGIGGDSGIFGGGGGGAGAGSGSGGLVAIGTLGAVVAAAVSNNNQSALAPDAISPAIP